MNDNTLKYIEYAKYGTIILGALGVHTNPELINAILIVGGGIYGALGTIKTMFKKKVE